MPGSSSDVEVRAEFPPSGLLVLEDVLQAADAMGTDIWSALEDAAVPVAVEYQQVSESEIATLQTVSVNATAQQAMVHLVKTLDPREPTLFRVVLPKGAELVKAVGKSGFRGFSRTGGNTAHALLKPVAITGAVAAGWPIFAVAATVTAVDMVVQREVRAHQRRVESLLGRQEERHYISRARDQKSADAQLTRAISLMLDGQNPDLELARKSADDEFYIAQQFVEKYHELVDRVVGDDGRADYRRLEEAIGGKERETESFIRDLHLARSAIAIQRKAIIADAAGRAIADPANPYTALRRFMDVQVRELEEAEAAETELTDGLAHLELRGRWYESTKAVEAHGELLRARISPPQIDDGPEVRYLLTSSGEILQVLPPREDESREVGPEG